MTRGWQIAAVILGLALVGACGDDDDDGPDAADIDSSAGAPDAPVGTPDAPVGTPDAPVGTPDAPVGTPDSAVLPDAFVVPDAPPPIDAAVVPDAPPPIDAAPPADARPPADAGMFGCPDGICQASENCATCHADCGECPGPDRDGGTPECPHDECTIGGALAESCSECTATVCAFDSFCCDSSWDSICVGEVETDCGKTCP